VSATRFDSLLVANRGEIAQRVIRSARLMGIHSVAVYVPADADAPFVKAADEAVRLPGSYLDGDAVIAAAQAAGAQAIHPGYGFLSENARFADAVIGAGLVWVGPSPRVIEAMGDKIEAKLAAQRAGVPILPSSIDVAQAAEVGYPLLVKAAAGGGGKGMRIVSSATDLDEALAGARREALGAFGDDRVFLERYVPRARHVEIQILGDLHGALVHLGERECSIQRRHQKIVEEAPSPRLGRERQADMGEAAVRLAAAIGYQSAGTVEFLLDDDSGEFFFLEVNTRLQVEHPVTEAVTGLDLVREQLRIAMGEPLGLDQSDIAAHGHAIEARLYAEDPAAGFLPATGTLAAFAPAGDDGVRWDSGVAAGSLVGVDFDPMLAKVIAHAPTRHEAASVLARALERLHIGGVTTNRDFLVATLRHAAFLAGDTTTDFIERVRPRVTAPFSDEEVQRAAVAAALWLQGHNRASASVLRSAPTGWRNARMPAQYVEFLHVDRTVTVRYASRRDGTFDVDGVTARVHRWMPDTLDVDVDGRRWTPQVSRQGDRVFVQARCGTIELALVHRFRVPGDDVESGGMVAPMPGRVIDVRCAPSDRVTRGQTLVVLEAMKMEHHVAAPFDGVVVEVRVQVGDQVTNGALLVALDAEEA
jgi:propionyl-CoA carboxylase alpha chain